MDRIMNNLHEIVYEEVRGYASSAYKGHLYFNISENEDFFSVIFVPDADYPTKVETDIVVAARLEKNHILIERDDTDRPLYQELLKRGIPRENIVLRYAGETLDKKEKN